MKMCLPTRDIKHKKSKIVGHYISYLILILNLYYYLFCKCLFFLFCINITYVKQRIFVLLLTLRKNEILFRFSELVSGFLKYKFLGLILV